ncbi:MAG: cation transporter [Oscillospiraceae bacterium]|nr:cation transporter [Oscillospiraceae bacterium]
MTKTTAAPREKVIIRTSVIGIATNLLLAATKAAIGMAANSVAVISDAVNNLSDALSSIITILGTKLAGRAPDKKHPLGYGRIEYMSALIVSAIVLYAGLTALVDSVKKILTPEAVDYAPLSLILLAIAIAAKLILGAYVKKKGKQVSSGALVASGEDASHDAILSASVLASAAIYLLFSINLEAWVGAMISIFIIKSGIEMISDAVSDMLGARVDGELSAAIKQTILQEPEVHGVYDLLINNYGPEKNVALVHVEVDDAMTALEIDELTRKLQAAVYEAHGVILGAVGIYAANNGDHATAEIRENVRSFVVAQEGVLQFHGFYADVEKKQIRFDVVMDFSVKDRAAAVEAMRQALAEKYPDYNIHITLDVDVSD